MVKLEKDMSIVKVDNDKLENDYDGFELYYDNENQILYSSIRAIARWVGCDHGVVRRVSGSLNIGKNLQIPTPQGFRTGCLFTSQEVVTILSTIAEGKRTKPENRKLAKDRLARLATIGYEFTGMLAVTPERVAKIAIDHTTTVEQVNDVSAHLDQHNKYLGTYKGLHDELQSRGAKDIHHATVNKYNNELIEVEPGQRKKMSKRQKDQMIYVQLIEKMKLEDTYTKSAWHAVNISKNAGKKAMSNLARLLA